MPVSRDSVKIEFLISLFLLISPFLVFSGITNPHEFPKFLFAAIVAQCLAFLLLIQKSNFELSLLSKLILVFVAISFFSDILGLDPKISLLGSPFRHQGFLLLFAGFIFYLASTRIKNSKSFENSLMISSFLLCLITFFQFIWLLTHHSIPTYNGRVVATLGNPDFLGAYIAMILPFILFANFKQSFVKPLLSFIMILSILITQSRSALLAAGFVLIAFVFSKLQAKKAKIIFSSIILLIVLILVANKNFLSTRTSIWDTRGLIWSHGVKAVIDKPLLGVGQENFELVFPKALNFKVDNAHNIFLEIGVSSGIIGLILFALIVLTAIKQADLKIKLAIAAFLITAFFNPSFVSSIILFWILIGLKKQ